MRYLKRFESKRNNMSHPISLLDVKSDIEYIFVDLLEEYPELKFELKVDSPYKWKYITTVKDLGEYESKNYLHKMSGTLETIKGRLFDIDIICNYLLQRSKYNYPEIVINICK